ncbi:CbtA family protein [Nocardioides pocheonensis]|uniref:CbtA family protein n=1 Tax=Nocardioides pocheonensis TaxID=661485 RepID=A0A3N0GHT6_9ACTN|nr:CbtA family protein [Nocardioides pocheonensis]RNM11702.1 hypothetical protein EFL26_21310 [Nocardioides pocheonensis]
MVVQELTWARRLKLGAAAGAAGGAMSSVLLWLLVEPAIRRAILVEEAVERAHGAEGTGHEHGEIVTRVQQQIGGTIAVIVVGVLLGLVFCVIYARVSHRLPGSADLAKSLNLGALAFIVHGIVPGIAVPANPPGVGNPETVHQRTLTYLAVLLLGCAFVRGVFALGKTMADKNIPRELSFVATIGTVIAGTVILLALPHLDQKIASPMPANLVWDFRTGSLAELAGMWAAIGTMHGFLIHRARTTLPPGPRSLASTAAVGT